MHYGLPTHILSNILILFIDREWAGTKKYELSAHYSRVDNLKHTAAY